MTPISITLECACIILCHTFLLSLPPSIFVFLSLSLSLNSLLQLKYKADAGFTDATGLLPHEVIPQGTINS